MMFNKPRHIKEPNRVGKPSESLQFKAKLNKKLSHSGYDTIREIVEKHEETTILPPSDKQSKHNNVLNSHKKYSNNKKSK